MRRLLWGAGLAAITAGAAAAAAVLLPLPVSVQLWLARSYPDYFLETFEEWSTKHSALEQIVVRTIAAKARRDWANREVTAALAGDRRLALKALVSDVNELMINQHEIPHASIDQPAYARLVLGLSWCDGLNHLLVLAASEIYDAELYYLFDEATGTSPHTLAQVRIEGHEVYADVFNGVDVYPLSTPAVVFQTISVDEAPASGVVYPRDWFANGARWSEGIRSGGGDSTLVQQEVSAPPLPSAGAHHVVPYLEARVLHVNGDLDGAADRYREAAELCSTERDQICQAAAQFSNLLFGSGT